MSHLIHINEINADLELEEYVSIDTSRTGCRVDEAYFVFDSLTFGNGMTVTDENVAQKLGQELWEDFNLDAIMEAEAESYDWAEVAMSKAQCEADMLYDQMKEDGWN